MIVSLLMNARATQQRAAHDFNGLMGYILISIVHIADGAIHDGIWAVGVRNAYRSWWDLETNRYAF